MIDQAGVEEILAVYTKYGWLLRRVLLSADLHEQGGITDLFADVPILESDLDAAWFSRPYKKGGVAWEIRHLSETPYALLEVLDEDAPDFEASLQKVESRLRENVAKKRIP